MEFKENFPPAVISGILLALSFPKYGTGIVAWMALVPLLISLNTGTLKSALMAGLTTGFVFNVGIVYWIASVVVNYGYLPPAVGLLAMLLLAAYLSLYVALFAGGVVYLRDRRVSPVIAAPLLWTSLEYVKSHLLTGFPWENLGYSQYLYIPFIQISDITGIYGITFVIVFINAIISDLATVFVRGAGKGEKKRLIMEFLCGALLLVALWAYGSIRILQVEKELEKAPSLNVSLIQGNIDQNIKWNPQYQNETLEIYKSLSLSASPPRSGIIVWPETAAPFYFQEMDFMAREVVKVAMTSGNWLLFGSPSYMRRQGVASFLNSAFLLSPEGKNAGRYDKVHLVPYGEYVPLRGLFPFISKLAAGVGDFKAGEGYHPLFLNNCKIGVLICYEGIFPEGSRTYRQQDADLLVNITNDAWFGRSSAPYQHLSMTAFRAVENRLYLLRAANTGMSAIIDPTGKIISHTNLFAVATLKGKVRFIDNRTFYMAYGDVFVYLCLIFLALVILTSLKRRKKCWTN
ncbi:MAG: apolipoprotein N-acyltransferase [Syntrophobacteraceae bacterium CG23_combo_of_CG06-09_8_20_14_all_50_8]|nr:MAG: apolipoprotein N-acyltransferase [Syntrophobacteraceae bacterium CG23_combo_of_CG06-09_8_20_14_all_50_8]